MKIYSYDLVKDTYEGRDGYKDYWSMQLSDEGEWVEAKEAEALEQLNKKMLEVLKEAHKRLTDWKHGGLPKDKQAQIEELLSNIINKAEEV